MLSDYEHRLLKKNHATGIPTRCLFIDTETKTKEDPPYIKHRMDMAWVSFVRYRASGVVNTESWDFFEKTYPLNRYIDQKAAPKSTLYIIGHNIFFDLQVSDFFYYFTQWGWVRDFYYESQLTYILIIRKGTRVIKIISTTNFFNTSLEKLGDMIGFPKAKIDLETASWDDKKEYCRRDVEVVRKAIEYYFKFTLEQDLGRFSLTQASQSFRAFRHRFMLKKIYFHDNKDIKALERAAYHGGRVECYRLGKQENGPFLTLDVNSMYPFVMSYSYVPYQLIDYKEDPDFESLEYTLKDFCVVAEVDLKTDTPLYSILKNNKLIFPVGRFRAFVCTHALRQALYRKHLIKVHRIAIYKKAILFKDYVDYFYNLKLHYKETGNTIMGGMVKIFLNSLYGKFGQKVMTVEDKEDKTCDGYWSLETYNHKTGDITREYKMFNVYTREISQTDAHSSFCAISAHITEAARLELWRIIEYIGVDKVLYCDTDSIVIREADLDRVKDLIDPVRLGKLKVEKRFNTFDILGAKSYVTEKERRIKGVPVTAKMIDKHIYHYMSFLCQASHLKDQVTRYYLTREVFKVADEKYDKGQVDKDKRVTPFQLLAP